MSLYILDTNIVSMYQTLDSAVLRNVLAHQKERLAITTVTVMEELQGWQSRIKRARDETALAATHERLQKTVEFMFGWEILPLYSGSSSLQDFASIATERWAKRLAYRGHCASIGWDRCHPQSEGLPSSAWARFPRLVCLNCAECSSGP